MNADELKQLAHELSKKGFNDKLKSGEEAINVSFAVQTQISGNSRTERKQKLKEQISKSIQKVDQKDFEIDFNSISTSGQTINAKLNVNKLSEIHKALSDDDIGIYPNTTFRAI